MKYSITCLPRADFAAFVADHPAFAAAVAAVAAIHAIDWRVAGSDFVGVPGSAAEGSKGEVEVAARRMPVFGCADEPLARWLFRLGVVYHGWKAYGTEPWCTWAQIEDLLTRSLAEL